MSRTFGNPRQNFVSQEELLLRRQQKMSVESVSLGLKEHGIAFVVPMGMTIEAEKLQCPGGMLIMGTLIGKAVCLSGSIIVAETGRVAGSMMAQNIYIAGTVITPSAKVRRSGRLCLLQALDHVALSSTAKVRADLCAQTYDIKTSTFFGRAYDAFERDTALAKFSEQEEDAPDVTPRRAEGFSERIRAR
jgi:hypothetical protein